LSIPVELGRRIFVGRTRALQRGIDAVDLGLIGRRIKRGDNVALLDLVAGFDTALQHPPTHPERERSFVR